MKTDICQTGHPVLRQRALALPESEILTDGCQRLILDMIAAMREAPGVGLAAPQIGVSLQIAVIEDRPEYLARWTPENLREFERVPVPLHVIINPELELLEQENPDEQAVFFEGCLSVAGFGALVPRAKRVRLRCLNERAEPVELEASGWHARILQHEVDHLHGRLYLDRMLSRSFCTQEQMSYWTEKPVAEVCRELGI